MSTSHLILKRAATSRPSGKWDEDDYDVLADGDVVGRIFQVHAAPVGMPWMWTLVFGHHEDRTPTHDYAATREAAMAAFAKSWRRQYARPAIGGAASTMIRALRRAGPARSEAAAPAVDKPKFSKSRVASFQ